MKRAELVKECEAFGIENVNDGTLALQTALEKILADPSAVFEVADEVKALGFHAAAEKLHRNGYAHTKEDGVCMRGGAPANAKVWGSGPIQRWVVVNPRVFDKDIRRVAKQCLPRHGAAAELRRARRAAASNS